MPPIAYKLILIVIFFAAIVWFVMHITKTKEGLYFTFFNHIKIKNGIMLLTTTQFVEGQVQPLNKLNEAASVEAGSVKYESSDESILKVEANPDDETKFKVTGVAAGKATLKVTADADLGDGVETVQNIQDFEVVPAKADHLQITFGDVQEEAPAA